MCVKAVFAISMAVLSAAFASIPATAAAQNALYASGTSAGGGSGGPSTLYAVDPGTAATTAIGTVGYQLTGLAVDPTTGVLYGATGSQDTTAASSIITVDKSTGAGTVVGPEHVGGGGSAVADIAFMHDGQLIGWSEQTDDFVTINKATGAATAVGNSGVSSYGDGMSVDQDGTIFAMLRGNAPAGGDLRTVDPATGLTTIVASLSGTYNDSAAIPAAAFGCDGRTLYAIDGLSSSSAPDYLATVNTSSGEMTPVGQTTVRLDGLAWDCSNAPSPGCTENCSPASVSQPVQEQPTSPPPPFPAPSELLVDASGVTASLGSSGLFTVPGVQVTCVVGPCNVYERAYEIGSGTRAGAASARRGRIAVDRDTLASGQTNAARMRLTKKAARKLRRRGSMRLEALVTLTDAPGRSQTVRKKFTLRARR